MNNIYSKLGTLLVAFFLTWFALSQINWVKIFKVEQINKVSDEKLGNLYWSVIQETETVVENPESEYLLKKLVYTLCEKNGFEGKDVKVHLIAKDEVNAFALPGGHLIVYSRLIEESRNQDELCGVLGHEIAHIKLNHVMKKLGKEVGISVIANATAGNAGGKVIQETMKHLTSTAYDRDLEREADKYSVKYMLKANLDPHAFADFMSRMETEPMSSMEFMDWVSTHPNSKERVKLILEQIGQTKIEAKEILTGQQWSTLKNSLSN